MMPIVLEFHDVEIDLDAGRGKTRSGHEVGLALITSPRIVAFAFRWAESTAPDFARSRCAPSEVLGQGL
jgi:hypothetical protein